jgi:hypothetical protein
VAGGCRQHAGATHTCTCNTAAWGQREQSGWALLHVDKPTPSLRQLLLSPDTCNKLL